jgi:hypothetical protein
MCSWLGKLLLFGKDEPPESDKVSHALQPLATLFVFFLAQVVGATIAEQGKGIRYANIVIYIVLGLWTLISIYIIVRNTSERLTFVTGRAIFRLCLALWFLFAFCGLFGLLPGQGLLQLGVSNVEYADGVTDGLPGLKVHIILNGRQFHWGMPSKTTLYVFLDKETAKDWQVARAKVEEYLPNGQLMPALTKPPVVRHPEKGPTEVVLTGLFDGPTYRATISLERFGDDFDEDVRQLASPNAESIRKKYQVIAERASRQIAARAGINVRLEKSESTL